MNEEKSLANTRINWATRILAKPITNPYKYWDLLN